MRRRLPTRTLLRWTILPICRPRSLPCAWRSKGLGCRCSATIPTLSPRSTCSSAPMSQRSIRSRRRCPTTRRCATRLPGTPASYGDRSSGNCSSAWGRRRADWFSRPIVAISADEPRVRLDHDYHHPGFPGGARARMTSTRRTSPGNGSGRRPLSRSCLFLGRSAVHRRAQATGTTMEMLSITLPDGSVREVAPGTTPADIAAAIGPGLAKAAIAARVDGELRDITRPLEADANLALVTSRDEKDALELARHDFAHVLAEAVQNLFPGTQITFGPSTDDGFYYDFAPKDRPFTEEDLPAIEAEMRRIIAKDEPLIREVWSRADLIDRWRKQGERFKAEWAAELPEGEELTVYRAGRGEGAWLDMCRGPHLASTGKLDPQAFKLTRVSGAYWRGDQSNAMLSRIYGTGWLNKKQLDQHLFRLEEAAKRDHRKLGQEMDLFHLQAEAHGSVFWHPKGYLIWRELEAYMRRAIDAAVYREVKTPQVMDALQWEASGHWGKYRENMFVIPDEVPNVEDDDAPLVSGKGDWMALKPMNCPAHVLIFRQGIKSYRDLPLRLYENGCCHRNEPHGALHGLMRVRQFTQDDAHIFCREDQIVDEVQDFCRLADRIYRDFGFKYSIKLALRPDKRFGSDADWDKAENELRDAVAAAGRNTPEYGWEELPGEGAC